ncbi:hypothetical protein CEXT_400401 [Caerostris extrusa]|uniref:Uncharacterized protein n=1 Tax=Caerostris extrusa TaxID=172846 RepID=A0AAV4Q5Z2_CAEEX|nr:hypothetical protein CEXT_400401 [Caerostris extrusa]
MMLLASNVHKVKCPYFERRPDPRTDRKNQLWLERARQLTHSEGFVHSETSRFINVSREVPALLVLSPRTFFMRGSCVLTTVFFRRKKRDFKGHFTAGNLRQPIKSLLYGDTQNKAQFGGSLEKGKMQ